MDALLITDAEMALAFLVPRCATVTSATDALKTTNGRLDQVFSAGDMQRDAAYRSSFCGTTFGIVTTALTFVFISTHLKLTEGKR